MTIEQPINVATDKKQNKWIYAIGILKIAAIFGEVVDNPVLIGDQMDSGCALKCILTSCSFILLRKLFYTEYEVSTHAPIALHTIRNEREFHAPEIRSAQ